jgi:hypothetical protein
MLPRIGVTAMEPQAIQQTQDVRGWTLRLPLDGNRRVAALALGHGFNDYHFSFEDEATGSTLILNDGPAKNGTNYPGYAATLSPSIRLPNLVSGGETRTTPTFFPRRIVDADSYTEVYQVVAAGSHLPAPW